MQAREIRATGAFRAETDVLALLLNDIAIPIEGRIRIAGKGIDLSMIIVRMTARNRHVCGAQLHRCPQTFNYRLMYRA